jgi:hypothetical protein
MVLQVGREGAPINPCWRWRICCRPIGTGLHPLWGYPCFSPENERSSVRLPCGETSWSKRT